MSRREFPVSINSGFPRPAMKPAYRKATMLDLVRGERRVREKKKVVALIEAIYAAVEVERLFG
jgi:hypothetical protein